MLEITHYAASAFCIVIVFRQNHGAPDSAYFDAYITIIWQMVSIRNASHSKHVLQSMVRRPVSVQKSSKTGPIQLWTSREQNQELESSNSSLYIVFDGIWLVFGCI